MIKSYKLKVNHNNIKNNKLLYILKEYRKFAKLMANKQWYEFFYNKQFNNSNSYKSINSVLTERWKDVCKRQVDSMLKSFISNKKNDFKSKIYFSTINEELKIKLFYINKYNLWFTDKEIILKKFIITIDELKLARNIFKHILNYNNKPTFKNINMVLTDKVCLIQKSLTITHDYWLRISSFKKADFIYIPIKTNDYYENIDGELKKGIQLIFKNNKLVNVVFMKEIINKTDYKGLKTIGIDIGLRNLIATSEGDLMGKNWLDKIDNYNVKIVDLQRKLKKNNIKYNDSKRYRRLIHKRREFIKNEINRIFNRFVLIHKPKEIIMEKLYFKKFNLGKRLNRLMNNFGKSVINSKLESLKNELGIKITYINAAYTSQICPSCGYIHKDNRKERDKFKCIKCNKTGYSDIVASKNIKRRSFDKEITLYMSFKKVYDFYMNMYHIRIKNKPKAIELSYNLL